MHKAYLQAKDIFTKASTKGSFPLLYEYNAVIFGWQDIILIGSYDLPVSSYLINTDEKLYDKFKHHLYQKKFRGTLHHVLTR